MARCTEDSKVSRCFDNTVKALTLPEKHCILIKGSIIVFMGPYSEGHINVATMSYSLKPKKTCLITNYFD